MTAEPIKSEQELRYATLDDLPPAQPLSPAVKAMSEAETKRRAAADSDAGLVPEGFWDGAQVKAPDGTEQITLRLPRSVISHFKATGKGYHSRISAVLTSYVDAMGKKTG